MCGISGLLSQTSVSTDSVRTMADALQHRGPDDSGVWTDSECGIGLSHRRLSIIDLSPSGHQPMASASDRYMLVFNGEIYNHRDIRKALESEGASQEWRGHSDTETLLAAIDSWGLKATLGRTTGMFALALWDKREGTLSLARDRFGEKPLYYGWAGGVFAFASELGSIRTLSGFDNPVNRAALSTLLSRTYIPAPLSIYQNIYKLPPATILTVTRDAVAKPRTQPLQEGQRDGANLKTYWSYRSVVQAGLGDPISSLEEATDAVEAGLREAVSSQAVADVPVGAFLSGGFDSSTVVALYHAVTSGQIKTFSIGFEEAGFDEAVYAREVADHFGTDHHEMYVSATDALAEIPRLPQMYGEPFADSSAVPTHLVSAFARRHVTVALSGDGGDELFGGYNRYLHAPRLWGSLSRLPAPVRRSLAGAGGRLPDTAWTILGSIAARRRRPPFFGSKVKKALRTAARAQGLDDVFASLLDEWHLVNTPVLGVDSHQRPALDMDLGAGAPDAVRMMYADAVSYLPDDILAKVDRAAMACSLETRVPFLDHNLAAIAARVPLEHKIAGASTKHVLRQVLYRHAPRELFERPKAGFALPLGPWLRGPLRDWAEDLLDPSRMRQEGYLDPAPIRTRWKRHLDGTAEDTPALWAVLMFQAWLRENGPA
ncbi:asparagine synthase (glutamine-hydrolyzing) [Novosphingopyxis sp. YJ-S2-01]|uniref:asparagine synthase (glutamine-hydrolyzing) n=1 Tax=Novosphingopyxis sp. YJ-S2-01 TaxID=2794021 RepID=UPI0018DD40B4|nr:asparagine synthase (glutamine-hydrolyzing) [Novosphingopyxis sp. YJ-S2-01]MBH9538434.1 asparagine synthase (glutamine-hydrolyzing) [Novosphingopyxis sp. YJ-S2-01]